MAARATLAGKQLDGLRQWALGVQARANHNAAVAEWERAVAGLHTDWWVWRARVELCKEMERRTQIVEAKRRDAGVAWAKAENILAQADVKRLAIHAAKKREENLRIQSSALLSEVQKIDKHVDEIKTQMQAEQVNRQHIGFWADVGFGPMGVPSFVFDRFLSWLNIEGLPGYSELLLGDLDGVRIEGDQELKGGGRRNKLNLRALGDSYAKLSDGGRSRVDFCLMLAFQDWLQRQAGTRTNLLILDECFGHVDVEGMCRICDLLERKGATDGMTIFVVTHDARWRDRFHKRIHVVRENGESKATAMNETEGSDPQITQMDADEEDTKQHESVGS